MDLTNVFLKHEEMHFASDSTYLYRIYVSEIESNGVYLVTIQKDSVKEFVKDKEVFVAMVKGLDAAREKALKVKKKLIDGEELE